MGIDVIALSLVWFQWLKRGVFGVLVKWGWMMRLAGPGFSKSLGLDLFSLFLFVHITNIEPEFGPLSDIDDES